ncbi:zinc finger and BTB domain-containing protein 49 isoform X1 [Leptonychotes weddellii]|uniref:Zinc finger and BTB domain-containing protein 49 isoform X1 n=1 Tax=Leptonychotes weddellii TaxID=9713 RepID=A0A7F8Q0F0_LEPWE|nr:zinc finger and BTB domain-containing protein 49 isoform X1 [Leptonychotes weddellii]XP_030873858.1 zinc finger and BTB domain-containing protein 49 isoform X1 [Leptonychotes weddellii]XP_030873859.1 zinc finger and BTB domain-containing protein 49 isoform X1 [Leptonychotes weddellii]
MDPVATHGCHLLQQLHEQRIQGLLCDCMLVVKGVCFKAHKNVLAAFSQYFRSLFQNSSGQKSDVFHLDIKNVSGIGQILDFMYTSHLDLNQDNIQVMLDIAQCLQVQNVLNLCHTFLKSTTVEQPPGVSCNSAFSLQSTPPADAHCAVSENYPPHLLQECPADVQQSKVLDESHSHAPPSINLHQSAGEASKQAPNTLDGACPELPFRQPSYYYKLRNFYSKQYYKQAACPGHERVNEQPFTFSTAADLGAGDNQPCAGSHSECVLESSEHLPSHFLAQPLSESAPDPDSDNPCQPPTRQMRLKKAIHLKKLNFLKSQKSAEEPSEGKLDDGLTKRVECASANTTEKATSHGAEEKEGEELVTSERFNCTNEMERPEEPAALEDQSQMLQSQRQYTCELCGKPFKHPSNLELHRRSHTGEKPFECNICGKHFSQAGNLQTHLRRHSGEKPYICEICGKRWEETKKEELPSLTCLPFCRGHLNTDDPVVCRGSADRSFLVPRSMDPQLLQVALSLHCGLVLHDVLNGNLLNAIEKFAASGDVQRHIIIHSGEKPHLCDICGRGFSNFSNLKEHKKTHTADKVFTCDECGKSFNMQRKLVKHRIRHTGERPYSCSACGKCFGGSGDLRRHVRTHTGEKPYTCEICSKCFTRSAVLRRHEKMHCRPDGGRAALDELAHAIETPDLEKSQGSESFSQDVSVTLMPVSVKLPVQPAEDSVAEFDGPSAGSYCKFRPVVQPPAAAEPEKLRLDPGKLAKPPMQPAQPPAYAYPDVAAVASEPPLQPDSLSLGRSSLATLDNHCGDVPGGRGAATPYRNSEGQFFSSMTLWGLAMKTLQNENELDQ